MNILAFSKQLSETPLSQVIQNVTWIIPLVQSVHILAIAIVMASTVTIDLRLVGATKGGPSLAALERRFLPWFWGALSVLAASGLILIIGEPARELLNWMFYVKIGLVLAIVAVTAVVQVRLRARPDGSAPTSAQQFTDFILGGGSLVLIVAIITAGRWIAYVIV
jgi:hypothetical protein